MLYAPNEPCVNAVSRRHTPSINYPPRVHVPSTLVPWAVPFPSYRPGMYTADAVAQNAAGPAEARWADQWDLAGVVRPTHCLPLTDLGYEQSCAGLRVDEAGYFLNPVGRTGLRGQGLLGKVGPNQAGDLIITRTKPPGADADGADAHVSRIQFAAICRKDTGEIAIPGGMINRGEMPCDGAKREFLEEALRALEGNPGLTASVASNVNALFASTPTLVYRGYVDDCRNTDTSWMETHVYHYHISDPAFAAQLPLHAGDDAARAFWVDITDDIQMWASHRGWVLAVRDSLLTARDAVALA